MKELLHTEGVSIVFMPNSCNLFAQSGAAPRFLVAPFLMNTPLKTNRCSQTTLIGLSWSLDALYQVLKSTHTQTQHTCLWPLQLWHNFPQAANDVHRKYAWKPLSADHYSYYMNISLRLNVNMFVVYKIRQLRL